MKRWKALESADPSYSDGGTGFKVVFFLEYFLFLLLSHLVDECFLVAGIKSVDPLEAVLVSLSDGELESSELDEIDDGSSDDPSSSEAPRR
jgi:hypothetical protein